MCTIVQFSQKFSQNSSKCHNATCNALLVMHAMICYAMQCKITNPKPMPNETKSPPQGPNGIEPRALIPSCHAPDFKPGL